MSPFTRKETKVLGQEMTCLRSPGPSIARVKLHPHVVDSEVKASMFLKHTVTVLIRSNAKPKREWG